jgi:hypothetical protein
MIHLDKLNPYRECVDTCGITSNWQEQWKMYVCSKCGRAYTRLEAQAMVDAWNYSHHINVY